MFACTVIKTVWYWQKNRKHRLMVQDRMPEINPHTNGYLIFDREGNNIQWRKDSLFNKWCWIWIVICKRMKLEHFLTQHTIIGSNFIKELNVRQETINLLKENIVNSDINHSKILYDIPPRVMEIKAKINKSDL